MPASRKGKRDKIQKAGTISAQDLKRILPDVEVVAGDLYGIHFKNGVAHCPFGENHTNGDRDPSLRYDREKNRLFCASQHCFGEKGADVFGLVQRIDQCSFGEAVHKLNDQYGVVKASQKPFSPPRGKVPQLREANETQAAKLLPAEQTRQKLLRGGFYVVAEFIYDESHRKVRFEHNFVRQANKDRPKKTFRWEHLKSGCWYSGRGKIPIPLYVNRIFRERDQAGTALGFEGEAKANLAGDLGFAAFSFKDITAEQALTLVDCDVVLWPDNDASGARLAEAAARIIQESKKARTVKLIRPADLPPSGDIIDAVNDLAWDRERINQLFASAASYQAPPTDREMARGARAPATSNFQVSDDGVFFLKEKDDGSREPIALAARLDVIAETRDGSGNNWGRLLRWRDNEGRQHEWAMPMELLASDAAAVRARLLGEGLPFIATNLRLRERFTEYLQRTPVARRVLWVRRIGWLGDIYVLPDAAFGAQVSEEILYQPPSDSSHQWNVKGTVEDWRRHVGSLCSRNSRLVLAVSCGFAGPLLALAGAESGGIHFGGANSTGKTTALIVGGSVCGGGGQVGFVQPWRATINGLEAVAEAHNDATLFLDELAQVDAGDAADTAYLLANGQGKTRMTKNMSPRKKLFWRILFVSAGEITLSEHAASAGKRIKGGAEVRMLNIEAEAGRGMGIFEDLHGVASPDIFVSQLKEAARHNYGAPLRAFVENVQLDRSATLQMIRKADASITELIPEGAAGEVRRAAQRFALIAAAGELATHWNITGWQDGEAIESATRCFTEWLKGRGTHGNSDVEMGIGQVQAFLSAHGASRFQLLGKPSLPNSEENEEDRRIIKDRAGFRRRNRETGETEFLIFRETFRGEVCAGRDFQAVARELDSRGFLLREPPSLLMKPHLPGFGRAWVYGIRAAILEAGE
jgi:putative DNA primase/helicase